MKSRIFDPSVRWIFIDLKSHFSLLSVVIMSLSLTRSDSSTQINEGPKKKHKADDCTRTDLENMATTKSLKEQFEDDIMNAVLKYAEADGRRILSCENPTQVSYVMWDICCLLGGRSPNPYLEQEKVRKLKDEGFRLISPFLKTFFLKWTTENPSQHDLSSLWDDKNMFSSPIRSEKQCAWFTSYKLFFGR